MSIASQLSFSIVRGLVGGNTGTVVYQTGTNVTGFVPTGNTGTILVGNGTSTPVWDNKLTLDNTTNSTSTTTGALIVKGGIGSSGKIYSETGNPDENFMLYTPKSTVSGSVPADPRIGDVWIDPSGSIFYQYILDNGSKTWVQIN